MIIPHNKPSFDDLEAKAVERVISSGWVAQGSEVREFENELCDYFGLESGHALAVSSGSSALYLALKALEAGDKTVGLPVYACAALTNAISLVGAKPYFLDTKTGFPNITPNDIYGTQCDVLIAPSMYGLPVDVPENFDIPIIEDIAQAFGARSNGKPIGLRGTVGICSFYATKLFTTGGQGGAVLSSKKEYIDFLRDYREFDCRNDGVPRFNFQMTDIQAAIGRVQLKKLPSFISRRDEIYNRYKSAGMSLLGSDCDKKTPVRYRAILSTQNQANIIRSLMEHSISSIIPIMEEELLDKEGSYPNAIDLTRTTVSLPIYPSLTDHEVDAIIKFSRRFL